MKKFEHDLDVLRQQVISMGELAQSMVDSAIESLLNPERAVYQQVLDRERRLDQMQLDIDHEAIRLLTVYGPVATDLRFTLMVSRITMELERVGDQAVNMCEDLQLMAGNVQRIQPPEVEKMARLVAGMLRGAMSAFLHQDGRKAMEVLATDDLIDAMNDQVVRELLSDQVVRGAIADPSRISDALAVILIARSLERIGDQATNICEEVIYMIRGDDIRHRGKEEKAPNDQ